MEASSEFMESYFGWHIPVPVPSDTKWGPSMADEFEIEGVREAAKVYREELTRNYITH
jgi:hypothetical protein